MHMKLSYSRNYFEMVCHPAGSSHPLYSHRQGRGEQSSFDTNVPRKSKLLPHYDQHEAGIKSRLDPCFHGAGPSAEPTVQKSRLSDQGMFFHASVAQFW